MPNVGTADTEKKAIQYRDSPAASGSARKRAPMPTMKAAGNLSARLRIAQGHRPDDAVTVPAEPVTKLAETKQWNGEGTQCSSSVMAGQRCNRATVVGETLCRNHLAMMGTPATRPASRS
jgi:hypothetical protein